MAVLPIGINPATGGGGAGGYQIERSLRFNSADSTYLNRTPASTGSQTSWTWSGWVKRSVVTNSRDNVYAINNSNRISFSNDDSSQNLVFEVYNGAGADYFLQTSAVYRDVSAWYHIVAVWDSNNATAGDRQRLYVNGVRITAFSASGNSVPSGATSNNWNGTAAHNIGRSPVTANYFGGYLTEINFIDGQALTPSDFGETDSATGVWKPKAYSGTYGTNGFYLKFADNSGTTSTTLGKDSSGNGNNWTPNNFSVTAGAGNDSLVDTPTNYGTDTGIGGEVRGNYCTWNSAGQYTLVNGSVTRSNGNLESTDGGSTYGLASFGTIAVTTGKWYWEVTLSSAGGTYASTGVVDLNSPLGSNIQTGIIYGANSGNKGSGYQVFSGSGSTAYGATYTTGDIIGVALDLDVGTITFYKNGVSQGVAFTGISGNYTPAVGDGQNSTSYTWTLNCGQRAFAYTAPSGFKALCTQNLPTPTIGATSSTLAGKYFSAVPYTATENVASSITGVGFQPDFVWVKTRADAASHALTDAVRGVEKALFTNTTGAEVTSSTYLTSFNSDGFTQGGAGNFARNSLVAWNWNAGGSTVTNTSGTISAQVRANTTSGFSIVTYTGTGATGGTVGHGLGVKPGFIIVKKRSAIGGWVCWHQALTGGNEQDRYIYLDLTSASGITTNYWGTTGITSSTFGVWTTGGDNNTSGSTIVAYCFAPVAGYSAFGSYTGNGSTDGVFVYTGFRPKFVMIKGSSVITNWTIVDAARNTSNVTTLNLRPNTSGAETTDVDFDLLSNGFKLRGSGSGGNNSGSTYIYMAIAESPFKFSLGR